MRDYEELVNSLRIEADGLLVDDKPDMLLYDSLREAADAIEELQKALDVVNDAHNEGYDVGYWAGRRDYEPKWIKIENRPMTEEERKEWSKRIGYDIEYEDAIIYVSPLPDDGQEVLVCSKWGHVWIDTFSNDPDYGVGFENNGDMDGIVAWMPLPKPYEPPKEEADETP